VSTFNGFGTIYYGWRHAPDGTSTATKWLVALLFPLLPLGRRRLRRLSRYDRALVPENVERFTSTMIVPGPLFLGVRKHGRVEILERLSLQPFEVLGTWLAGCVAFPATIVLPIALSYEVGQRLLEEQRKNPFSREARMLDVLDGVLGLAAIVWAFVFTYRTAKRCVAEMSRP
jgi:hypothetical protein